MDLYILDSLLRRTEVVDAYDSLIWTERWQAYGDFELTLNSTVQNRSKLTIDTKLAINDSLRVMIVESIEDKTESDGKEVLVVRGRSLEKILKDRVAKLSMANLEDEPFWVLSGTPANNARTIFDHICRPPGGLSSLDLIPFLMPGTIFSPGTIPEPAELVTMELRPDTVYDAIRAICEDYDLGFRLVRKGDTSELYFDVYTGDNRTTKQTLLDPVVFSKYLDNIEDTTEFNSIQEAKNVAYVFANEGTRVVYPEGVDPSVSGLDRRVLYVNANVDEEVEDVQVSLLRQGLEALKEHTAKMIFDGEVNENGEYIYGVHYELGDLVEMRNKDNVVTERRVTEQIFVSDDNGIRSYPTLSSDDEMLTQDTWLSWSNKPDTWSDFGQETWAHH